MTPGFCLRLSEVAFQYRSGKKIFEGLNLEINRGEMVSILGANGSGKTTLLKILAGLLFPCAGRFYAWGRLIDEDYLNNDRASREFRRRIGYVFQQPDVQLFTTRVFDEVAFGPRHLGLPPQETRQRVEETLEFFGLSELADESPHLLSGGEKKKVALASVLVLDPPVLLLDEPTGGLDPRTRSWLADLLAELSRSGRTVVTATHDLDLVDFLGGRACVLSEEHRVIKDGPVEKILGDRELLTAANLLGELRRRSPDCRYGKG